MSLSDVIRIVEQGDRPLVEMVRRERPYRIPPGYMPWSEMSGVVAASIVGWRHKWQAPDQAALLNSARITLWFTQDAPIYCLSHELLQSFQQTDIQDNAALLADLRSPLPTVLLLFPLGAIQTPDRSSLDFCVVHLADREHPERSHGEFKGIVVPYLEHEHDRNLHWSGVDRAETAWVSGAGLEKDGTLLTSDRQLGGVRINQAEREFLAQMRSLVLQCLLAITYRPDLMEDATIPQQGFGKPRQGKGQGKQVVERSPRWLGKDYKRPAQAPGTGTHASPREHWRRGHWRRVVDGPRELGQRRWVWIEPTFVKGG